MTDKDYKIMELLMLNNQRRTKGMLSAYLHKIYPNDRIIETNDFIYCQGEIPIGLVAHLDTVMEDCREDAELFYDVKKQVMFCPGFPGFDDKAGIFSILKIVQDGYHPSILLCCDEESGGKGAQALVRGVNRPNLKYLIELDRAGYDDIVYYQCGNKEFQQYTQKFGFILQSGSFSDISFISPPWDIASCNIACGYLDEHTEAEVLHTDWMERTINLVENMLEDVDNAPYFDYQEVIRPKHKLIAIDNMLVECEDCGNKVFDFETIKIDDKHVCYDCAEKYYWGYN